MRYALSLERARPLPVVNVPLASTLNEIVSMILSVFQRVHFFVIVDLIKYCSATVLKNKASDTVIRALFMFWITTFSAPA